MNLEFFNRIEKKNNQKENTQKPTVKGIIKYCKGGYFGDSDIFGSYISSDPKARDSTAITLEETVIFSMPEVVIYKIQDQFEEIF